MEKKYKTFDDLEFESWLGKRYDKFSTVDFMSILKQYENAKQAIMTFPNGYGVSVLLGKSFYSNGIDTYEVAVIKDGNIYYPEEICPDCDVLGYRIKEEVTDIMRRVQDL